ncbi:MAG: 3'(2'),5'-bisphosphate nucleotidase CysQ, partial [Bacteroidota bacterium]|nr:3'(2'),5'-bisphosphate nucleotidase CysQ [Bacteroidota bacterium]
MENLLLYVVRLAHEAGDAILDVLHSDNLDTELKEDHSPVTQADKKASRIIVEGLKTFGWPVISEEEHIPDYSVRKHWDRLWIVDPLDGTKEFINRSADFTVNIALVENNRTILGVVYAPQMHVFYFGAQGVGAYRMNLPEADGVPSTWEELKNRTVQLPVCTDRTKYVIVGSRSHMNAETKAYIGAVMSERGQENVELVIRGSSLKFCIMAEGKADLYPRFSHIMEWDIAAGHAVA